MKLINTNFYKDIISLILTTIIKNTSTLPLKLIIPTFLLTVVYVFFLNLFPMSLKISPNMDFTKLIEPAIILFFLVYLNVSIAITTFRVIILGEESVPTYGSYLVGLREFKYMLYTTIVLVLFIALCVVLYAIPYIGVFLIFLLVPYLVSRFSFIFPACAVDNDIFLTDSWNYTKQFQGITYFAIVFFPMIISIVIGVPFHFLIVFISDLISSQLNILYALLNSTFTVIGICGLATVYNFIKPQEIKQVKTKVAVVDRKIQYIQKRDTYKIVIPLEFNHKFETLKKDLYAEYEKQNFTNVVYDRPNAWILKINEVDEAYVSLRRENDEFIIQTYKTKKPQIKLNTK